MKKINAEIPDPIYRQAIELAQRENIPVEQLVSAALTQALGAWLNQSTIQERAKRGNRESFLAFMNQVPSSEADEQDGL